MGIKQLYNDNLRKLPNEYGDVSVMVRVTDRAQNDLKMLKGGKTEIKPKTLTKVSFVIKVNKIVCKRDPSEIQRKIFENSRLGFIASIRER